MNLLSLFINVAELHPEGSQTVFITLQTHFKQAKRHNIAVNRALYKATGSYVPVM
jgi:hypothetical protein